MGRVQREVAHRSIVLAHAVYFPGFLTSMGLTGVEGRGCRYSGWRMCPLRAVSILSTLMGSRPAWRRGSLGGTACTNARLLAEADPLLVPDLSLLSGAAGLTRLAEASGEQIMSPTQALG